MPLSNGQTASTPFGVDGIAARAIHPRIKLGRLRAPLQHPNDSLISSCKGNHIMFAQSFYRAAQLAALPFALATAVSISPIAAQTHTGHDLLIDPADAPNAIHLTANDLGPLLSGDPFGLARLLAFETGISFHSTGDFGAEDWITIRSFGRDDSRIILILVDGRPINQRTHTVDFDDIILGAIETISIYPGPLPARFGGFQSVIDIRTRNNVEEAEFNVSVGSRASYEITASFGRAGETFWGGHFELGTTEGQSFTTHEYRLDVVPPFFARPPELLPFQPVPEHTFSDTGFRYFNGQLYLGRQFSDDLELVGRLGQLYSRKSLSSNLWEVRDYTTRQALGAFVEDVRYRRYTNLSVEARPGASSELDYSLLFYYIHEEEELGTEGKQYYLGEQRRDRLGVRARYRQPLTEQLGLSFGGEFNRVEGEVRNPELVMFPWGFYDQFPKQNFYGVFAEFDYRPWSGGLLLAGLRHDGQSDAPDRTVPKLSFEQRFMDGRFAAYAMYGESNRWIPPSELERPALLNKSIHMERITGTEVGFRASWMQGRLLSRLNWFELDQRSDAFTGGVKRTVTGSVEGLEVSLDYLPFDPLRLRANLTRFLGQEATQMPGEYNWLINFGVFYQLTPALLLEATARYTDTFVTGLEPFGFEQSGVTIVDIGAHWRFADRPNTAVFFGIYNAFNEDYKTFPELPHWRLPNQMPGRHLQATLTVNFQ